MMSLVIFIVEDKGGSVFALLFFIVGRSRSQL